MKISKEEAGTLLNKYLSEKTPLLATIEISRCRASVSGTLDGESVDGVPCLLIGDCRDEFGSCIQFEFKESECEFAYGDLREGEKETLDDLAQRVESFLTITSRTSGVRLGLIELKNRSHR